MSNWSDLFNSKQQGFGHVIDHMDAERLAILRLIVANSIQNGEDLESFRQRIEAELQDEQALVAQAEQWLSEVGPALQELSNKAPHRLKHLVFTDCPPGWLQRISAFAQPTAEQRRQGNTQQAQQDTGLGGLDDALQSLKRINKLAESMNACSLAAELSSDLFAEQIRLNADLCRQILGVDQPPAEESCSSTQPAAPEHPSHTEPHPGQHHPGEPSAAPNLLQRLKSQAARAFAGLRASLPSWSDRT